MAHPLRDVTVEDIRMFMPVIRTISVLALLAAGCSRTPPAEPARTPASADAQAPAPGTADQPAAPTPGAAQTITGPVVETMDAGTYTYVRVKSGSDDVWAATNRFKVSVGERVTVPLEMPMNNFHSKALNREFPLIYFASYITREGEPPPAPAQAVAPMDSHSPGARPTVTGRIPAARGVTPIDKVWATRASLKGKPVTVRGKVVKYNGDIMGVNWLHLQDGTGTAGDKTNDLAVTTPDVAAVGDIVTATGTVAVDKDFGAGYTYPVIIERATLSPR